MGLLDLTSIKKLKDVGVNLSILPEYVGEIDNEDNYTLTLDITFNSERYNTGLVGTNFELKKMLDDLLNILYENPKQILK